MDKQHNYRFSEKTEKELFAVALAEATQKQERVSHSEMLRRLINKAFKKLK